MIKTNKPKRIALRTETVRMLAGSELARANGGLPAQSFDYCGSAEACVTIGCSSGVPCTNSTVSCGP